MPERAPIYNPADDQSQYLDHLTRYQFASRYVEGKRVLDLACGTGYGSKQLFAKGNARYVLGLDVSREAIAGMAHFTVANSVNFALAAAERLPVRANSFDAVVSLETIEHLRDPRPYLEELNRILCPSGTAIISTPINNGPSRVRPQNPFHVREFSEQEFRSLMDAHFASVEIWSQVNDTRDDLCGPVVTGTLERVRLKDWLRRVTPIPIKRKLRAVFGFKGRYAVASSIVKGRAEGAVVQIALCTR